MSKLQSPELERLAGQIAHKLEGHCDAVVSLDELIDDAFVEHKLPPAADLPLRRAIDRRVFLCKDCGWWHPQTHNARPDAEWICKDCARDEHDS